MDTPVVTTSPTKPVSVTPVPPNTTVIPTTPKIETPIVTSANILAREVKKTDVPLATEPPVEEIQTEAELNKLDPISRAIIEKKVKDLESGYNKKYQTLATQRKEIEDLKAKLSNWTPQRLKDELNRPDFIQSMQTLQQSAPPQDWQGSTEEWSSLNDSEKRQFQQMRQERSEERRVGKECRL